MKFAYIKLLKTLEKKIVKTKNIIDFDTYIDNPSNKQMYLLHEKNLKKSCRILLVGETQEELENIIAEKRIPDPKINDSDKIEDIMDTDDETDETSKNDDDGKSDENRSNNDRDDEDESDKDEEEVIKVQRKKLETKKKQ
ncbi:phosphopantothenoylcysteine decarboxylase subunit VHS3-like [Chelonus insularis]|uniref:phosphopantothenoylcysteine decarboxylase subunit VHS3-like n=1 Tax=Chelonus insularis TaxID=460826 RepID=UPI0015893BE9|nr:phosphopantothenoylcysteine decarboxylase subunit VHS3-like [Chelonus insularis]